MADDSNESSGFIIEGQVEPDATTNQPVEGQDDSKPKDETPVNVEETTNQGSEDETKPRNDEGSTTETPPPEQDGEQQEAEKEVPSTDDAEDTPDAAPGKQKPRRSAQKRINKAIKRQAEAEAKAERLQRELDELKATKSKPEPTKAPVEDDFDDYDDFLDAEHAYKEKRREAKRQESEQKNVDDDHSIDDEFVTAHKSVRAIIDASEDLPDDFHEKTTAEDLKINTEMVKALAQTDAPQDVLYHLANNPQLASEISQQSPKEALKSIFKIEFELANPKEPPKPAPKPVQQSQAPEPIKPVGSSGNPRKSLNDMTTSEYMEYMNKREREEGVF